MKYKVSNSNNQTMVVTRGWVWGDKTDIYGYKLAKDSVLNRPQWSNAHIINTGNKTVSQLHNVINSATMAIMLQYINVSQSNTLYTLNLYNIMSNRS